jgi:hypothetical protein
MSYQTQHLLFFRARIYLLTPSTSVHLNKNSYYVTTN